ncbi:MAG: hypothetical protein ACPG8V_01170 [Alphaproteobacteria bacterium]
MTNTQIDIKEYVKRCLTTLEMCCEEPHHKELSQKALLKFKNATVKSYSPNVLGCLQNKDLLVDTKLAKEFQNIILTLPFESCDVNNDNGEDAGIVQLDKNVFDGLDFHIGFMVVDANKSFAEDRHEGDELFMIINGTAEWLHNGNDEYETLSAGNIAYNGSMQLHGTKANHTPTLALYIVL